MASKNDNALQRSDSEPRLFLPGAKRRAAEPAVGSGAADVDRPIDVLALLRTAETKEAVISAITAMENVGVRAGVGGLKRVALAELASSDCDLLLLDVDFGDEAELQLLQQVIQAVPQTRAVVVTSDNPTVEGMRHLMRLGIVDLVPQPIKRADLLRAFTAAIERRPGGGPPPPPTGKLLCFMNACGGMGATTLAVQSACSLADPDDAAKVVLLDLDIQFGNVAVYLDLQAKSSAVDLQKELARLDGLMLKTAVARHRCGVDVLAAPQQMPDIDAVTPEGINRLLQIARREYRHVIVDLPHVWNRWTRTVLAAADAIVVVFQSSVPSVRQARRQIELLNYEGLESAPLALVLNRHESGLFRGSQGAIKLGDVVNALGREVPYTVPNDYKAIQDAVNHGLPLAEVKGGKSTAKQIGEVVKRILAQIEANQRVAADRP